MKATISELWDTGRELINFDNNEYERPTSFSDLKKCENVLIGDKIEGTNIREVLIDNSVVLVAPAKVTSSFGGTILILEIQ